MSDTVIRSPCLVPTAEVDAATIEVGDYGTRFDLGLRWNNQDGSPTYRLSIRLSEAAVRQLAASAAWMVASGRVKG